MERTKKDWVHMALRYRCCAGLCPGGERVCLCLVQLGAMGPGVRVEGWLSGLVPRPFGASHGNMQILGPYTRNLGGAGAQQHSLRGYVIL